MASAFAKKIVDSIENLVTLEIVTAVGNVQYGPREKRPADAKRHFPDLDYDRDPKIMFTKIDLLQGDIKTVYDEAFVTGEYQQLKAYHATKEKEGYQIVQKNIETLERLLKLAAEHIKG